MSGDSLKFIKDCKSLQWLYLDDIAMSDLSLCGAMAELKSLSAINCGIQDISALKGCPALEKVYLAFNEISDISALSGAAFGGYSSVLDLGYNNVSDVTPLNGKSIYCVALQSNPLSVKSSSFNELQGSYLAIDYTDGLDTSGLVSHPIIRVFLAGCPNDKQVAIKDALGSNVLFVTAQEQVEALGENISYEKWAGMLP